MFTRNDPDTSLSGTLLFDAALPEPPFVMDRSGTLSSLLEFDNGLSRPFAPPKYLSVDGGFFAGRVGVSTCAAVDC